MGQSKKILRHLKRGGWGWRGKANRVANCQGQQQTVGRGNLLQLTICSRDCDAHNLRSAYFVCFLDLSGVSLILENVCVLTLFWFSLGGMRGGSGVGTPGQGRERAKPRGSQHGSRLITQSRLFSTFKHQFCLLPPLKKVAWHSLAQLLSWEYHF